MKPQELHRQIETTVADLAALTDAARRSEQFKKYCDFAGSFYRYSAANIWLIMCQAPHASQVAGFTDWKKRGRYVKKGEKGIGIFAPCIDRETQEVTGFRAAHVFDVSQTEGDDLPEPPNWKSQERRAELEEKLQAYATELGVTITYDANAKNDGEADATTTKITLKADVGTRTLIHEIAHTLLNHKRSNSQTEIQADATAFVVCNRFELPAPECANYLATWTTDPKRIMEELAEITRAASQIIQAIERPEE